MGIRLNGVLYAMISGPGYMGPSEVRYLFVDGGALLGRLQNLSQRYFGGQTFEIDFNKLKAGFTKVFYYDALPLQEENETKDQYERRIRDKVTFLDKVAAVDGVHVYEGDARRRRKRGLEQKKVDVMLTVDVLTHTFRRNMHKATLLTGDNDFKPLIDAVVQEGMYITLWYPVDETSRELMHAADGSIKLSMQVLQQMLTDESARNFSIPQVSTKNPSATLPNPITQWLHTNARLCVLYQNDGVFVITQEYDANNTLYISHQNFELLKYYCRDSMDIFVPEI